MKRDVATRQNSESALGAHCGECDEKRRERRERREGQLSSKRERVRSREWNW